MSLELVNLHKKLHLVYGVQLKKRWVENMGLPLGLFLGLGFATPSIATPVAYQVDTPGMHASINFKVKHLGFSWLTGRFNSFSGQYVYDADNVSNSKVEVSIETSSVNSNHAERDKHLRSADFLNVKKHPIAKFVSTSVEGDDNAMIIIGNFTLNGVTKPLKIKAQKIGEGEDPWGGYRSGFMGTTEFKMKDFNIQKDLGPASATVYLDLHIEGTRK
jgi:polyisoprenoid-binding protein YceI